MLPNLTGQILRHYQVLERLGQGKDSVVHKCIPGLTTESDVCCRV